jgi:NDP-sugar pyrophosphorylase family protein
VRVVGVIPAAGYATRLQPLSGSKEALPVGERPALEYVVARMRYAGCDLLRIVTRPEKADVIALAESNDAEVVLARPQSLAASIRHGLHGLAPDDVALIGFPDSVWQPVDGFARLLTELDRGWDAVLGLFHMNDTRRFERVATGATGVVRAIDVRPPGGGEGWIWGAAAARVAALPSLADVDDAGTLFADPAARGRIGSVRLGGDYVDIGTHDGLRQAASLPPQRGSGG